MPYSGAARFPCPLSTLLFYDAVIAVTTTVHRGPAGGQDLGIRRPDHRLGRCESFLFDKETPTSGTTLLCSRRAPPPVNRASFLDGQHPVPALFPGSKVLPCTCLHPSALGASLAGSCPGSCHWPWRRHLTCRWAAAAVICLRRRLKGRGGGGSIVRCLRCLALSRTRRLQQCLLPLRQNA